MISETFETGNLPSKPEIWTACMHSKKVLNNNLLILRFHRRLTLHQLSRLTEMSASYLSRLENGKRRLNVDHLRKLAVALECSLEDILTVSDDESQALSNLWSARTLHILKKKHGLPKWVSYPKTQFLKEPALSCPPSTASNEGTAE